MTVKRVTFSWKWNYTFFSRKNYCPIKVGPIEWIVDVKFIFGKSNFKFHYLQVFHGGVDFDC